MKLPPSGVREYLTTFFLICRISCDQRYLKTLPWPRWGSSTVATHPWPSSDYVRRLPTAEATNEALKYESVDPDEVDPMRKMKKRQSIWEEFAEFMSLILFFVADILGGSLNLTECWMYRVWFLLASSLSTGVDLLLTCEWPKARKTSSVSVGWMKDVSDS